MSAACQNDPHIQEYCFLHLRKAVFIMSFLKSSIYFFLPVADNVSNNWEEQNIFIIAQKPLISIHVGVIGKCLKRIIIIKL